MSEEQIIESSIEDSNESQFETMYQSESYEKLIASARFVRNSSNGTPIICPRPEDVLKGIAGTYGHLITDIKVSVGDKVSLMGLNDEVPVDAYRKYMAILSIGDAEVDDHYLNVGIVVNNSKGTAKVFAGARASACFNGVIFGADCVTEVVISNEEMGYFYSIEPMIHRAIELKGRFAKEVAKLKARTYNLSEWYERIGELLVTIKPQYRSFLTHAVDIMANEDSLYYHWENSEWKLFSAMTDDVKNRTNLDMEVQATMYIQSLFAVFND